MTGNWRLFFSGAAPQSVKLRNTLHDSNSYVLYLCVLSNMFLDLKQFVWVNLPDTTERERERHTHTQRQTDRQRLTDRQRQSE